jgi:hypothetical protein
MRRHGVHCLLMGGQACVFYGAAEFSRDVDFVILAEPENLRRLQTALSELKAAVIAIPAFEESYLHRGLAIHFRCQAPGVEGLRIDVMTVMRGVDPFPELWERRTTITIDDSEADLLSLPDLVKAKKTQRAKDWPMLTRLVEAHWFQNRSEATAARIDFWLRECRTPEILLELATLFAPAAAAAEAARPVLTAALAKDMDGLEKSLEQERLIEVAADRAYWAPLREELEHLRRRAAQHQSGEPPAPTR